MWCVSPPNKPAKTIDKSVEDLQQRLLQLRLDLDSAHFKENSTLIKDISRSIKTTTQTIEALKRCKQHKVSKYG